MKARFHPEPSSNPVTVTRQHAQQLREFYLAKGLHPTSVKDRVDWVRSMLNYEVEEIQRLSVNPWPRLKVEGSSMPAIDRRDTRSAELKADAGWGREHVFHSFRHGVETILKRAKEPKPHIDRYTGHRRKDVADRGYKNVLQRSAGACQAFREIAR
jgi:hypothetical protein